MTAIVTVSIQNVGGIYYINGKRLGHDTLTEMELIMLNEFIKEYRLNTMTLKEARDRYKSREISFDLLEVIFYDKASTEEKEKFWKAPVWDRPLIIEGLNLRERDLKFNKIVK